MAIAYKYSQVQGTAGTSTYATLYESPAATEAVISSIVICNQSSGSLQIRIGLDDTAGTPDASQFLVYDVTIAGNDTIALTLGVSMPAGKFLRASSSSDTCSFTAFVSEIS